MRVVVTGGTGFIGRALVAALVARGDEVSVLTRDPARARAGGETPAAVALLPWGDRAQWTAQVGQSDAVVNLAGEGVADARWTRERLEQIKRSRIETTSAVADAVARAPKKLVWVSGSAVGIYGMRKDDQVLDENGEHGADVLGGICEAWEKATAPAKEAGARVAIARTGIVLGPDGGALAKMLPPFRAFAGGPLGDGRQWLSWIHIEDAVRGLLFALDHEGIDGPFNLSAPKPVTMNEFARALGHALHRPSVMRVPAVALKMALGEGLAETLLTGQRAVPARLERAGFTFRFEEVGAALRDLVGA